MVEWLVDSLRPLADHAPLSELPRYGSVDSVVDNEVLLVLNVLAYDVAHTARVLWGQLPNR